MAYLDITYCEQVYYSDCAAAMARRAELGRGAMNETVNRALTNLKIGTPQTFHNLTLFPLLDGHGADLVYLTLGEALRRQFLTVTEKDEGGSVPELKVTNLAEVAVLLLDGEELVGAKQNRVLNATILLRPKAATIIDVSCTEQGRWSYKSREFADSDVVMARQIRERKNRSVNENLRHSRSYRSNQGEVWASIDALSESSGVESPTCAMRDVFTSRESDIQECLQAFTPVEGQVGFLFAVDNKAIGMDFVSRTDAYAELHAKLVKSYVIDAALKRDAESSAPAADCAKDFIARLTGCAETSYPSTGYGEDFRYEDRELCGSALVHEGTCVHAAFFTSAANESQDTPNMRGFHQRRAFRHNR